MGKEADRNVRFPIFIFYVESNRVLGVINLSWQSQCQGRKGQVASDKGREKRRMNYETHETHEKNAQKILVSKLSKFRVFGVFRG